MSSLLNDPDVDKLIIYALLGMIAVLGIAVIFLAVKKNTYYVDESGNEIPPANSKKVVVNKTVVEPAAPVATPVAPVQPVQQSATVVEPLQQPVEPLNEKPALATPISVKPQTPKGVSVTVIINGEAHQMTVNVLPALIGRDSSSCDLPIKEPAVSRKHARFMVDNGVLYIEDVSEHNGTYINGSKLPPLGRSKVQEGDKINLGRAEILVDKINY